MEKDERSLIRVAKNGKVTIVHKDTYANITLDRVLTKDGTIKQEALKFFLFSNAMKKARDEMRKVIIKAIETGHKADGILQAVLTFSKPVETLDKDKLNAFLSMYGKKYDDFTYETKGKKILTVE